MSAPCMHRPGLCRPGRKLSRAVLLLVGIGLLSACVTQAPRAPLPPGERAAALTSQDARETVLSAHPQWHLAGRVGLSNGQRGGSGRIEWQQDGAAYVVALSAPITRQSWRIIGNAASARIEGLKDGPRTGHDANTLLREATGWDIPVTALSSWVRGARATQAGAAQLQFNVDGRLVRMQQDGWTLDYDDWQQDASLGIALPGRINARRGEAKVRLVIDSRGLGATPP